MDTGLKATLEMAKHTLELLEKVANDRGRLSEQDWIEVDNFVVEGKEAITELLNMIRLVDSENNIVH